MTIFNHLSVFYTEKIIFSLQPRLQTRCASFERQTGKTIAREWALSVYSMAHACWWNSRLLKIKSKELRLEKKIPALWFTPQSFWNSPTQISTCPIIWVFPFVDNNRCINAPSLDYESAVGSSFTKWLCDYVTLNHFIQSSNIIKKYLLSWIRYKGKYKTN